MKAIVKKHPDTNLVITEATSANGTKYGKFRVEQLCLEPGENGVLNVKSRSAFITVFGDAVDTMKGILQDGMEYPVAGKIVRKESRTPFYEGQNPKKNPSTDEIHLVDGAPVYFIDEWSGDANAQDQLIRSSQGAAVASESLSEEAEG